MKNGWHSFQMAILKKPWFGDRSLPAADEEKLKVSQQIVTRKH